MLLSRLPEQVGDEEELARFLTQSGHYSSTTVKASAFVPSSHGETSVFRQGAEPREALWRLGDEAAGGRRLHGAAIIKAGHVRAAELRVDPDEPPPRHAAIRGWPHWDDPDRTKGEAKRLGLKLAENAQLVRK